ncbi:biotin--[acetyl-CoA-carboxylase] ligase [Quadrisphaera sp. DSM 44207]|uniref:biotin--[acetyl-CoA-carboxylase] ligase n=1 Tax=Quadrisphaera sp. DSM 44207 TaxID=1881057 RepID=UPI00089109DF|nr:biotin--[acetyl-CoA-carboxylase] ligase [Quadrisphaera sp. DSM 44207]SDQ11237.1 BirA family transcriptional regulator, biotin operon repressor / biotin-[acetyl-CoA-carboxylase] ligase [Quadrisphaera sp. DSM 44207]
MSGSPWSDLARPPLRAGALRRALLAPAGPLARLEVLPEVGSTNAELARRAGADPAAWPHLSALTTDSQTQGRGRLGRTWVAPPRSGVAVSVLLRPAELDPPVPPERWSWLPVLAGLAVVGVVRDVAGLPAVLKWPNDVLVEERKLCGVLAEVVPAAGGRPQAVLVGCGLNASTARAELPVPTATSLALEGAATTDRDTVLRALLRALAGEVARWAAAGGDAAASGLAARAREACATLGRPVRVDLPDGSHLAGVAEGLDDEGRLLVRTPDGGDGGDGGVVPVAAGDVVHVR